MNARGIARIERSVQIAVMRAPTTSLIEAVAEARRRQDLAEARSYEGSRPRFSAAPA